MTMPSGFCCNPAARTTVDRPLSGNGSPSGGRGGESANGHVFPSACPGVEGASERAMRRELRGLNWEFMQGMSRAGSGLAAGSMAYQRRQLLRQASDRQER